MGLIDELTSYERAEPEPEVEQPEPAEEPVAEQQEESEPVKQEVSEPRQKEREKTEDVPYGRFREVLEDRNSLKEKLAEIERKLATFEQARQQPATPEESPPDKNEDPVGYALWKVEQSERRQKELDEVVKRREQDTEYGRQVQAVTQAYQASAMEYAKATPDFADAYNHAINARMQQLQLMGADPMQAQALVNQEEINMAANALRMGKNPAELVYSLAKIWGYQPKHKDSGVSKLEQVKAGKKAEGLGSSKSKAPEPEDEDVPRGSFKEFEDAFKERGFKRRNT